jgi:hypothetical protein
MADRAWSGLRRHLPLILLVVFIAWIVLIIVLISVNPNPTGGSRV